MFLPLLMIWTAVTGEPREISTRPDDLNTCVLCHSTSEFWTDDDARLYVSPQDLAGDVHFQSGVKCYECHGGNPASLEKAGAHATDVDTAAGQVPFRQPLNQMTQSCGKCHDKLYAVLTRGAHGQAARDKNGDKVPLACSECHGDKTHGILPVSDPRSPVNLTNQVKLCGRCHAREQDEYDVSVHGRGLWHSGLASAVCADCHGAHGIFDASDKSSTLYPTQVADTCGKCHRFIQERLRASVHGQGIGLGSESNQVAPGGDTKRHPSCTDCHQGHDLPDPRSSKFRLQLPGRCGTCHVDISRGYNMSLHGALTELGYEPGAKCSDCHGAHDIPSINDPQSRLAPGENRLATCRSCHPYAVPEFCAFLPHADQRDSHQHPILHAVYLSMELLIYSVFAFFGVHTILWFVRSLIHVYRHGRPRRLTPGDRVCVRFEAVHRALHAVVAISFLGLALTGLPLRYSNQPWAQELVLLLGGFDSTSLWHRICGVVTILYFVFHLTWLANRVRMLRRQGAKWKMLVIGPDSPVPNLRDASDMYRMFRWFLGVGPKPGFERWTYWEKFDYWAVFWGVGIIGTSGLLLWFPNFFTHFLPGESLNVAKIVHSEEALLATSFIFAIHFFGTHLRPEKFPIDMSVLSGLVSAEEMEEERSDFMDRMRREGRAEQLETELVSRRQLVPVALAGFIGLAIGLCLLAGILIAMFHG